MSSFFSINKLQVKDYGEESTVPNNNLAKLIYYLDFVLTTIEYDN